MKINRTAHLPWAIFVLAVAAGATLLYCAHFHPQSVPPNLRFFGEKPPGHAIVGGTPLGLVFGTIAFAIFIFAALLGMRKRMPRLFPGHVQTWLRAHIWLTFLTVPLILLHGGFQLGSPMTTLLMTLYATVMVSGIYGLILQHKLPAWMKESLPAEAVYEQIPNIRAQLVAAAKKSRESLAPNGVEAATAPSFPEARNEKAGPAVTAVLAPPGIEITTDPASQKMLVEFMERELLPYLEARRGDRFRLGHRGEAGQTFQMLKVRVAPSFRPRVEEMRNWCEERRRLDLQVKLQHWLHGWLFVHAPLSFLLLLLTAWHAFVTLFRYS
ncbi:MAG: hypothetical protein ABIR71_02035 [Chthoniobacterales bacterium]